MKRRNLSEYIRFYIDEEFGLNKYEKGPLNAGNKDLKLQETLRISKTSRNPTSSSNHYRLHAEHEIQNNLYTLYIYTYVSIVSRDLRDDTRDYQVLPGYIDQISFWDLRYTRVCNDTSSLSSS